MKLPVSDIDFYSDDVIRDPYPVYKTMREMGPVIYLKQHNLYALSRYADVSDILRQPLRFISSKGVSPLEKVNKLLVGSTLNSDPPEHDMTRAITSAPLLPGALIAIEPRIREAAFGLIDTLCKRERFDAIEDLAQYLPVTIVAELVGLPDAGRENMLKWASATFNLFSDENTRTDQAFHDLKDLQAFLKEYGHPDKLKDGGWAKRIFKVGQEQGLSFEQCTQLMRDYINPSLDTTISTTGQIIHLFSQNPDQWDKLREKPELISNAVEEAVRLSSPIRALTRYAVEDCEIDGIKIPQGSRVLVMYASANRDPQKFEYPDNFDITRKVHDHLGFGQGVHMCMGMHLARMEMASLVEALVDRVERIELDGDVEIAMNNSIRAYSKLPVRLKLAAVTSETVQSRRKAKAREVAKKRINRIRNPETMLQGDDTSFTVVASKSEKTFTVNPGQFISDKLIENGIDIPVSCRAGVCGTCLVDVIDGVPDHRDLVQTDDEKSNNTQMTVCCSRSKTKTLTLDI